MSSSAATWRASAQHGPNAFGVLQEERKKQEERENEDQEEMHLPRQSRRWFRLPACVSDLDLEDRDLI